MRFLIILQTYINLVNYSPVFSKKWCIYIINAERISPGVYYNYKFSIISIKYLESVALAYQPFQRFGECLMQFLDALKRVVESDD